MERFVCDLKWTWRLSWTVAIALFVAVKVFGAPLMTIAYVYFGELFFFCAMSSWYRGRRARH